jgi:uncharacterized membrane protein (UPF0127 family)
MRLLRARNVTRETIVAERVEVAETSETRKRGLLGRTGLEPGTGLWLVPCEWVHMFGMKFAIDVVVLDKNNVVVGVQETLKPGRFGKLFWGAHSTLELPVGAIRASGTAKGDRVAWEDHTGTAGDNSVTRVASARQGVPTPPSNACPPAGAVV